MMDETNASSEGMIIGRIRHFLWQDEDGAASIETVILMPLFLVVLAAIVDATMIFYGQAQVLRVVQDANRSLSIGRMTSVAEAEDFVATALADMGPALVVSSAVDVPPPMRFSPSIRMTEQKPIVPTLVPRP